MIDNGKNNIFREGEGVTRYCYITVRGSSLVFRSATEEGEGLENGKISVT